MSHTPPFLKISLVIALAISSTAMLSQNLPFWSNNGNNVSSTDFFGSTNAADLRFRTNNTARMTLTSAGTLRVNNLAGAGNGFV
ncbi:MAG: hypothetical protein HY064_14330, partial [Bacteroidetes bacterium]|nr:hypothetical protein [Bacteroidota bacterium]